MPFLADVVSFVRPYFESESDAAWLFDYDVLIAHGYRRDGKRVIGPPSWPGGSPPRLGAQSSESSKASAGSAGSSGGGGTISPAEARRQIDVASTYEDWEAEVRREDFWDLCQERRAWMLGEVLADGVIASARHREVVRRLVAKDEAEVALWSEVDIRADYSPAEVGEG